MKSRMAERYPGRHQIAHRIPAESAVQRVHHESSTAGGFGATGSTESSCHRLFAADLAWTTGCRLYVPERAIELLTSAVTLEEITGHRRAGVEKSFLSNIDLSTFSAIDYLPVILEDLIVILLKHFLVTTPYIGLSSDFLGTQIVTTGISTTSTGGAFIPAQAGATDSRLQQAGRLIFSYPGSARNNQS